MIDKPRMRQLPMRSALSKQRGLSMIELLVGVAMGLFVTAGCATLLANQLRENRSVTLEARLMQDLRTAADIVARDLRRAGYWAAATDGVWAANAAGVVSNPYTALDTSAADTVAFRYSRDVTENMLVDTNEQFGFRLRAGAIELQLGNGNWQAMTDSQTLNITAFALTPAVHEIDLQSFCPTICNASNGGCGPRQQVRTMTVAITGKLVMDAKVTRSVRSGVRLRNDPVIGACAS